jgi:hypothetical protein
VLSIRSDRRFEGWWRDRCRDSITSESVDGFWVYDRNIDAGTVDHLEQLAMRISSRDDQKIVIQTEEFHEGFRLNVVNPAVNGALSLLLLGLFALSEGGHGRLEDTYPLIAYEQVETNPILKIGAIAAIVFSGLIFLAVSLKPTPPRRRIKDNYFFDRSLDTVYVSPNSEENTYGKLSDVQGVTVSLSTEGDYSVIVEFGTGRTFQMEYSSCNFFEADESQAVFRDLMFDSSQAVQQLRDFLNLD